jgi:hypothetical protein
MQESKKAITQTMGKFGRMRLRASQRDLFRASKTKSTTTLKIGSVAALTATAHSSASLRSVQTEIRNLRGGNDARRKAWKTPTPSFPPFPPRLEIRQNAPDSHISTAPTAAISLYFELSRAPPFVESVDGCRSLRSRSIRQRRFAPIVIAIISKW